MSSFYINFLILKLDCSVLPLKQLIDMRFLIYVFKPACPCHRMNFQYLLLLFQMNCVVYSADFWVWIVLGCLQDCFCNVYVCLCVPAASNVMTVPIQAALKATKQHPQILPKPPANPGSAGEDCLAMMQSFGVVFYYTLICFISVEYGLQFFYSSWIHCFLFVIHSYDLSLILLSYAY